MFKDAKDARKLFNELKKTLTPAWGHEGENYEHAMAKSRVGKILRSLGYDVEYEKKFYCWDVWDNKLYEYSIDVYAELYQEATHPQGFKVGAYDVVAIEIGGPTTYHAANRRQMVKTQRKRKLICEQCGIQQNRYIEFDKENLFSAKPWLMKDQEIIDSFGTLCRILQPGSPS